MSSPNLVRVIPCAEIVQGRYRWRAEQQGGQTIEHDRNKTLISLYLGSSTVASSFGAAGALALLLLWIYYLAQIFLFGAEFTRAWAEILDSGRVAADRSKRPSSRLKRLKAEIDRK